MSHSCLPQLGTRSLASLVLDFPISSIWTTLSSLFSFPQYTLLLSCIWGAASTLPWHLAMLVIWTTLRLRHQSSIAQVSQSQTCDKLYQVARYHLCCFSCTPSRNVVQGDKNSHHHPRTQTGNSYNSTGLHDFKRETWQRKVKLTVTTPKIILIMIINTHNPTPLMLILFCIFSFT